MSTSNFSNSFQSFIRIGLFIAALALPGGCSNSNGFSAEPGDYQGIALYKSDDGTGYAHIEMTIADDQTVTGTAQIYDFPVAPGSVTAASVPAGNYEYDISGATEDRTVALTLTNTDFAEDTISLVATIAEDGTITGEFTPVELLANWESVVAIVPDSGEETAVACGEFAINEIAPTVVVPLPSTTGASIFLVTAGGDLYGIVASDDASGTITGTYSGGGIVCGDASCDNDVDATFTGEFFGDPFTFTTEMASYLDFIPDADFPTDYTYTSLNVSMSATNLNAGFSGSASSCYEAVCGAGSTAAVCSAAAD